MRMLMAVWGALITLGLMAAGPSQAAIETGRTSFRGWWGFTTLALGDINDGIRSRREGFRADTLVIDDLIWDPMGGAPNLGLELEVQLTPVISAGLGFSSQRGSRRLEAVRGLLDTINFVEIDDSQEEDLQFSAWDVVGTLGLWVPSAPGLHFGGQLGIVRGTFESRGTHFYDASNDIPFLEFTQGKWKGTGIVLGVFTGYEQQVSSTFSVSSRMGYRYRNVSTPNGLSERTNFGDNGNEREWEMGRLVDSQGNPIGLDLGGFYFNIGLSLRLRGAE